MADEEKMTVRERRAQHAKQQARKDAPKNLVRKAALPTLVILLLAAVATGFYFTSKGAEKCPTHWHGTFGLFIPGQDNASEPEEVNFRTPYYDMSGGARTPVRAHMHQGDGFNQWHFEQAGTCVGVGEALGFVEARVSATSIELYGEHARLGQEGEWKAEGNQTMHAWIETNREGVWVWEERSVRSVLGYQLKDGEKVLIYVGDFTTEQIDQMKSSIRDPSSRAAMGAR